MKDTQVTELLGKNILTTSLLRAGIEVALPERDRGIDLIAYNDLKGFVATPIQMKASSKEIFSIDKKYSKFSKLILAYVWNVDSEENTKIFALTYNDALKIVDAMGWSKTKSWKEGKYMVSSPSKKLKKLLEPFEATPTRWKKLMH